MITHILNLNTKLLTLQIQYYTAGITIIKYRIKFRPHFKSSFLHLLLLPNFKRVTLYKIK